VSLFEKINNNMELPQTLAKPRQGVFASHLTLCYLACCGGGNYADYEHGAFAFNLEPPALENAGNADVLVLGNSKIQIALSNEASEDWFSAAKARYYLMGFSYSENIVFNELVLRKMHSRASVFVINVDDFFSRKETTAAQSVLHDPGAENQYNWKRFSQPFHQIVHHKHPH
jgi:hypothetical protein